MTNLRCEYKPAITRERLSFTFLQSNLGVTIPFDKPGDYVFIVEYYGGGPDQQRATFDVFEGDETMTGFVNFYNCSYL